MKSDCKINDKINIEFNNKNKFYFEDLSNNKEKLNNINLNNDNNNDNICKENKELIKNIKNKILSNKIENSNNLIRISEMTDEKNVYHSSLDNYKEDIRSQIQCLSSFNSFLSKLKSEENNSQTKSSITLNSYADYNSENNNSKNIKISENYELQREICNEIKVESEININIIEEKKEPENENIQSDFRINENNNINNYEIDFERIEKKLPILKKSNYSQKILLYFKNSSNFLKLFFKIN